MGKGIVATTSQQVLDEMTYGPELIEIKRMLSVAYTVHTLLGDTMIVPSRVAREVLAHPDIARAGAVVLDYDTGQTLAGSMRYVLNPR